jgi:predicted AAA+ superfamily ATPase
MNSDDVIKVIGRLDALLDRIEARLPPAPVATDFDRFVAFRWRRTASQGYLEGVPAPHRIRARDLLGLERQHTELDRNTRQFVRGLPANNALLWGARGTGKSSLIKAMLTAFHGEGLRLVEVDKDELVDLTHIVAHLTDRPERFVIYCDDLSFEADDASYKALKAVLDGSVSVAPENVLIYATSNRRHLMPEFMSENQDSRIVDGELHHGEAVEEKISLSERFGLWLSFHPFNQERYLEIVEYWLRQLGAPTPMDSATRRLALEWALNRGSRSGRVAWQFARDQAGRFGLESEPPET